MKTHTRMLTSVVLGDEQNQPMAVILYANKTAWGGGCRMCGWQFEGENSADAAMIRMTHHIEHRHA